jgi:SAM-dependent methyltransferase
MERRKPPLSAWLSEIFFEDNAQFRRRSSRFAVLTKALKSVPQAVVFAFSNFAAAYPAKGTTPAPQSLQPQTVDLRLEEWPRRSDGNERGLPYSDSVARSIDIGMALGSVRDLVFCMRELHRVAVDGAEIKVTLVNPGMLAADPTLVRPITAETLGFFSGAPAGPMLAAKAERAGISRLFSMSGDGVLRAGKSNRPARPVQIDIGSGSSVRAGFTGVDIMALPGVEIVRDVSRHGLPFSDSTIARVYTAHFLEHVDDLVFVMNEIHRVCCHDAIVEVVVPTLIGPYAAADPTHARLFNARTFSYFEPGKEAYAGIDKGFEILEQKVGLSIEATLRVIKE